MARREQEKEWRARWRAVPRHEQREVDDALRRAAAVGDPALAALAADKAAHDRAVTRSWYWFAGGYVLIALLWLLQGGGWRLAVAVAFAAAAVAQLVGAVRQRARLTRAEAANRQRDATAAAAPSGR